ncbi:hypothetical protein IMZ48_05900 [Candidatus Bathyarchaeota archaeon]|nr:hypothetical protein [Candidatus Bathyarchaeota archaeon]
MMLQLRSNDCLLSLVKVFHRNPFDILHHQVRGAIVLEADMNLGNGNVGLLGNQLEARALVQDPLGVEQRDVHVPAVLLPLGWAEAALDERVARVVVLSLVRDGEAVLLAFGGEFLVCRGRHL